MGRPNRLTTGKKWNKMPGSQTITPYRYANTHCLSSSFYRTCFPTQTLKPSLAFLNRRHPECAPGHLGQIWMGGKSVFHKQNLWALLLYEIPPETTFLGYETANYEGERWGQRSEIKGVERWWSYFFMLLLVCEGNNNKSCAQKGEGRQKQWDEMRGRWSGEKDDGGGVRWGEVVEVKVLTSSCCFKNALNLIQRAQNFELNECFYFNIFYAFFLWKCTHIVFHGNWFPSSLPYPYISIFPCLWDHIKYSKQKAFAVVNNMHVITF